ncbi:MAG TPA: hydroxyacid dehydrogenase [Polyangia bacterium]|jgi:phosphoglycerate dehydrogenase-like enzyme|nr:hydroxyacid dehydrogenase [Polyangia bacterium]
MRRAALFYDYPAGDGDVFGHGRRDRIAMLTDLYPTVVTPATFGQHAPHLVDLQVIFATWGFPALTAQQFALLPKLEAVFYAAGNVKAFAAPLIDHDVVLVSAWAVNAIATAQMVLSQVLLTCRGYFRAVRQYQSTRTMAGAKHFRRAGAAGETIGLIGMGWIARRLTAHLHDFGFHVLASDPTLTDDTARALGVETVSLPELFRRSYVVSNHVPDLPSTKGMLGRALFASMRDGATFINSGRGAQVVEAELVDVLRSRPDLTALLDVTWPEPPASDAQLWTLPNLIMSPHIGGTIGDEVTRLADCVIEEFISWNAGAPLRFQVTREILQTMG